MQVTDNPDIYMSYANINYNNTATHEIATQAWKIIKESQEQTGIEAISEIKEAVGIGKVITDLNEIFRAAKDGRGDLLMVHNDFRQAVRMTGKYSFDLVDDVTYINVIDDISSEIAWEVISKNGRVLFTEDNDLKELGNIVLKVRY